MSEIATVILPFFGCLIYIIARPAMIAPAVAPPGGFTERHSATIGGLWQEDFAAACPQAGRIAKATPPFI